MKIALVHQRFTLQGGTERYVVGLACHLSERGHDVHVFSTKVDPVLAGIRGLHFHEMWVPPVGGLLRLLATWVVTQILVKRGEFDVVHGFGRTTGSHIHRLGGGCHRTYLGGLLARTRAGWKTWLVKMSPRHGWLLWLERRQLTDRRVHRLQLVSEASRRELLTHYPSSADRLEVIHNGVDTQRFHPKNRPLFFTEVRAQVHLVPEDTVMLLVASDWERKGLDTALKVLAQLRDVPDLKLLVAGEDRRFDEFADLARQLGVVEQVHFAGAVERMERVYAGADLLLLPTRYDPFANVTLEALASEIPVVTTSTNGAAEVLRDCVAVRVVDDPEDVDGMAAAVREFLEHPDQTGLRVAARETALENRDLANFERVEALYRDVAASGGRG